MQGDLVEWTRSEAHSISHAFPHLISGDAAGLIARLLRSVHEAAREKNALETHACHPIFDGEYMNFASIRKGLPCLHHAVYLTS